MTLRHFGAVVVCAFVLMTTASQACEQRYPWLDCAGNLSAAAAASRRASVAVDASGNRVIYASAVDRAAWSAGVPVAIAHAIVRIESNYTPFTSQPENPLD